MASHKRVRRPFASSAAGGPLGAAPFGAGPSFTSRTAANPSYAGSNITTRKCGRLHTASNSRGALGEQKYVSAKARGFHRLGQALRHQPWRLPCPPLQLLLKLGTMLKKQFVNPISQVHKRLKPSIFEILQTKDFALLLGAVQRRS
jgi:6-phosphogluconate dehydrogenase